MAKISTKTGRMYGYIPDLGDSRDYKLAAPAAVASKVDLSRLAPPVFDQLQLGSCTSMGLSEVHYAAQVVEKVPTPMHASQLFIYYNERVIENTVKTDSGAQIRDGITVLAKQGVCSEARWPYNVAKFATKPNATCYKVAVDHVGLVYERVEGLSQMKACLASGYPFVFGITCFESLESDAVAKSGIVPMPGPTEQSIGGHCLAAFGYDDSTQTFRVQNSWGTAWGQKGWCTIPYAYLGNADLCTDAWKLSSVKTVGVGAAS